MFLSSFYLFFMFFFSWVLLFYNLTGKYEVINFNFGTWIFSSFNISSWSFIFDSLSSVMCIVVSTVSFLVVLYSFNYMSEDPEIIRFLSYLSLFTFFMIVLVLSDNLIMLFLGWEGVGLCSYLLIGFWHTRIQAGKSSLKALFMNRIGDFFILIATCICLKYFKSADLHTIFSIVPYFSTVFYDSFFIKLSLIDLISLFILLGAVGKSAQLGLHTWLPDAMEGPTPVSALIHAATMVTAGIYLIIRLSFLIDMSPLILNFMLILGVITSCFSGLIAVCQWDLKKIIAFSTCSQLGYMLISCGLSSYTTALYHLSTHAFFKALLFLAAGYVIHLFNGEQDIRKMGSLILTSPFLYTTIFIASLSLAGFIGLSGFYSKEIILHNLYLNSSSRNLFFIFYYFLLFSSILTLVYSFRLIYYVFFNENASLHKKYLSESFEKLSGNEITIFILFFLSIFSIFFGYFFKNIFIPGSSFFKDSVWYSNKAYDCYLDFIFFEVDFFLFILTIFFLFLLFKNSFFNKSDFFYSYVLFTRAYNFLNFKFYIDVIYNYIIILFLQIFFILFEIIEKGLLENFGPHGILFFSYKLSCSIKKFHTGYIHHYTGVIILSLLYYIIFFLFFFF